MTARKRILTASEELGLTDVQREYLLARPNITCLQPQTLAREALYLTPRHGAVTIDRAMELDAIHDGYLAAQAHQRASRAARLHRLDTYTDAEDRFVERHGMSSSLY